MGDLQQEEVGFSIGENEKNSLEHESAKQREFRLSRQRERDRAHRQQVRALSEQREVRLSARRERDRALQQQATARESRLQHRREQERQCRGQELADQREVKLSKQRERDTSGLPHSVLHFSSYLILNYY